MWQLLRNHYISLICLSCLSVLWRLWVDVEDIFLVCLHIEPKGMKFIFKSISVSENVVLQLLRISLIVGLPWLEIIVINLLGATILYPLFWGFFVTCPTTLNGSSTSSSISTYSRFVLSVYRLPPLVFLDFEPWWHLHFSRVIEKTMCRYITKAAVWKCPEIAGEIYNVVCSSESIFSIPPSMKKFLKANISSSISMQRTGEMCICL